VNPAAGSGPGDGKPIENSAAWLVVLFGGGAWWFSRPGPRPSSNATPQAVTSTEAPIDKPAPPVNLPPLDQMDGYLRPLLSALSSRPELARWLATDDLVRQLAMALDRAAIGDSPARDFKVVKPSAPFAASSRGGKRTIDPASYQRYDGLVTTITSIDASKVAQIYKTIRPRLNEAYQGLGHPNGNVDRALQQTLDLLIATPVVKDPIALREAGGAGWAYEDGNLESLMPAQKQLLRMGSANVDKLLVWLRALQTALR
jgi:hypothetical protein